MIQANVMGKLSMGGNYFTTYGVVKAGISA